MLRNTKGEEAEDSSSGEKEKDRGESSSGAEKETGQRLKGEESTPGNLNEIAKNLGINQFARPEVGEGFATFSQQPGRSGGQRKWGYHFAGVVARSLDKQDWVTFEHYNRKNDVDAAKAEIYNKVLKDNKKALKGKIQKPDKGQKKGDLLKDLLMKLTGDLKKTNTQLERMKTKVFQAWFFRLYGSHKQQTFHEQMSASGFFNDPLTLRVRKPAARKDSGESEAEGEKEKPYGSVTEEEEEKEELVGAETKEEEEKKGKST